MAFLNRMRITLITLVALNLLALAPQLHAQNQVNSFVSLCYHEVESDGTRPLPRSAVHVSDLAAQLAWLQAHGYHPVSLQQIVDARNGVAPLPDKAVLLTFDDGKKDVYTRVFPLLKLFHYPAVVALVGSWMEVPADGMVDYDGHSEPRSSFVSWDDVVRMQASGLIEIASHTYDLHRGVPANPQGSTQPAATTRIYNAGVYETDQQYLARVQSDMQANRALILQKTGHAPRALVWPYGRSNLAIQQLAADAGMPIGLTLIDGINTNATPLTQLKRHIVENSPSLQAFAEALRQTWNPDPARSVRLWPENWQDTETELSRTLDRLQSLNINISFVDPRYSRYSTEAYLFPSQQRPLDPDELNRIAWQIERRAGSAAFIDISLSWLSNAQLLGDLARHVNFAGVRLPVAPDDPRAAAALAILSTWRWPLRVAYAPEDLDSLPDPWPYMRKDDLLIVPADKFKSWAPSVAHASQVLVEFQPGTPEIIATQMRQLEADGFRQFGLAGFPESGYDAVWRALSLRAQPQLP